MGDRSAPWVVSGGTAGPTPAEPGLAGAERARELLVVIPTLPYPPVWGFGQRAYQLTRHLARRHRVTVVSYAHPSQRGEVEELAREVHEVVAVPREPQPLLARRMMQLRNATSRLPSHTAALRTRSLQAAVDQTLARRRFDVIVLESSQMGWLDLPRDIPVIVDEHNIESELLERMSQSERSELRRRFNRIEFRRYQRFETDVWDRSAACAATSQRDASMVSARRPDLPVAVVPNGVDVEHFAAAGRPQVPQRLVFTGLLDYRPNLDGITWFLDSVFPLIRQRHGQVQLQVVGHGAPEVLESLRRPGVQVTGRVPDLTANLDEASVAVVPLRIGGGTRLKVVEAMAMGKAIVSTTLGAEGIDVVDGQDLLLADDPADFADAVGRLLDEPDLGQRLGTRARRLAVEQYSWERSADRLAALVAEVTGPRAAGGAGRGSAAAAGPSHSGPTGMQS